MEQYVHIENKIVEMLDNDFLNTRYNTNFPTFLFLSQN